MNDRRSWVERLSGGRSTSTAQPPSSRPEPGPGGPVRSNGPEQTPAPGPGPRARPPVPAPEGPDLRLILVSRDNMLAGALRSLIVAPGGVRMLDWHSDELDAAIRHADVVIVDMPPAMHERTFAVIDGRFLGRTVVLLQEGEHAEALPSGPSRVVLYRPLQIGELWAAITGTLPPVDSAAEEVLAEEPERPDTLDPEPEEQPEPGEEGPGEQVAAEGEGLPVAESGLLIGLSGRELEPVVGPGQVAPGMDEATFERLRRWGTGGRQPATAKSGTPAKRRASRAAAGRAKAAEARRERSRQQRTARAASRQAARADAARVRAARAEARTSAREESRQARAAKAQQRQAARDAARQAKAAKAQEHKAVREEAGKAKAEASRVAAEASRQAKAAAQEAERQTKAAQAAERAVAQQAEREAEAAKAAERAAAQKVAREAEAAQAAERAVAQQAEREAEAAKAAERAAAQEEARQAKAAQEAERAAAQKVAHEARAAERAVAQEVARQAKAAQDAVRAEARAAQAAQAEAHRAEQAEARRVARAEARQARAARAEARKAARAEAGQARAVRREEARRARAAKAAAGKAARAEAGQARSAQAEVRKAARAEAARARAAQAEVRREHSRRARGAKAQARQAAREEAGRARAAQAEARKAAREQAAQAEAARAEERKLAGEQARQAEAARAEERKLAREQAAQAGAAEAEVRREESRKAAAARAEARQVARAEAGRRRAERAEGRRVAREEAHQARAARAEVRRGIWAAKGAATAARAGALAGGAAQVALIVVVMAAVGVAAAGWRGGGGPDTQAGEVAVVRAAGGSGGGLVAQDPRIGPIEPLHALAAGAWLRVTEAGTSLEAAVRDARVPSRFLLAGVVVLATLLFLLLMRVGPGTGAAAGPGPAPPQAEQQDGRDRRRRLAGAAVTGALVALDPLLVRNGRAATGTILAVLLALGALALAWGLPARPTLRRLPLVAAVGGLALLVSPLALPVLAVPVAAELLEGRYQEAWRDMAAVALAIGLWLVLPIWVAGQDLGAGQAGWLLGRPPGRGSVAASLAGAPLSWLLVAAGLAAAMLTWRHRSGARPEAGPGAARPLAWTATTAAGALVAIALGFPATQALAFATPAAAVSLALAFSRVLAGGVRGTAGVVPRWVGAGVGVALAGLLVAQGVDWSSRYGRPADDGLGRLVATVATQVPRCSAVNAGGPDDRARLLAAGVTVTDFSSGPAAQAAGVRYFVLTGMTSQGGPTTPSMAAWVRQHGSRMATLPSPSLSGVELWRVDAGPLDPVADNLPVPGGVFSNVDGSACGGYRVVDSQAGAFHTAYQDVGGKAVLGRPLGSVWTSDGPALQAFDTMVLGAVPSPSGPPAVRPIELPPLLAKLDVQAVARANIPLPSARPPVTDRQARALLGDKLIARAYLGTDPASASPEDWRRARNRFGRPLGTPQMMPDGAVRQPFERVVLELPADGGPARPAALGRLAVRLGLVPKQAMRLEPVPGLPTRPAETRLDPGPLLRSLGVLLALLGLAAVAGAVAARRSGTAGTGTAAGGR